MNRKDLQNQTRNFEKGPYLTVDKDGTECIFKTCPIRNVNGAGYWTLETTHDPDQDNVELPKGSIEKLIGKKLTWKDEPYRLV